MVNGKILSFERDPVRDNIVINVEYSLPNGKKVLNPYHAQLSNFEGKTDAEILAFCQRQIEYQCEIYIMVSANEAKTDPKYVNDTIAAVAVPYLLSFETNRPSLVDSLISSKLNSLAGSEFSRENVVARISDRGAIISEQLLPELAAEYTLVKKIEIDADGKETITDL